MQKKVTVIGGGIAGLSGAVRLARMGYDVHLFEKNPALGGKMGRLEIKGFTFDTGPTLITMPFVFNELYKAAGYRIDDFINIVPVEPICRYFFNGGVLFDASSDLKIMQENVRQAFGEEENFTRFLEYTKRIFETVAPVFIFSPIHEIRKIFNIRNIGTLFKLHSVDPLRTVHQAVEKFFRDPRLVQIFDRYPTYNGSNPYQAPATLNVIPYVELGLGGYYIKGGLYRLVESLEILARELNITINKNSSVDEILHDGRRITGISVNGEKIKTDAVLCNGDVVHAFNNLIKGFPDITQKLNGLEPSLSGLIFFWGIKGSNSKLKQHNIFFSGDYKKEFDQIFNEKVPPDDPTVYVSISSRADPDHAPPGHENWFVLVNMPYLNEGVKWEKAMIAGIKSTVLKKLEKSGFDIKEKIIAEEILTPDDLAEKFYSNRGSIYGISSNSRNAAFKRPANRSRQLKGLYFAGGSSHPGGGVPMCVLSGKFAAELIGKHEGL